MTNTEQDRWSRVKGRLRSTVGEDVYTSWFARMDLESVQQESVRLSVPTRFLKSWIQAHYAERVLTCWQAEMPEVHRIDLTVRTAMRCATPAKEAPAALDARRNERSDGRAAPELRATAIAPVSASHDALGGSPLDPRLTFGSFVIGRSNTLAHAAARQVAEGTAWRQRDVQSALHPRRCRPRQNPSAAGGDMGRQFRQRAQGAVSHRRKIHVRFCRGAEDPDRTCLQGSVARHRRACDRRSAVPAGQIHAGGILSHPECADRRRAPGGDRRRPSAFRSGEPRRPRAFAACRRPGGRDGIARRGIAARHSQIARRRGPRASCELRRTGAGAGLSGANHHP